MKTATVTELRQDFGNVLSWVEVGDSVTISRRGKIVALLSPPPPFRPIQRKKRPDFLARFKRIYGDSIFSANVVVEERQSRPF
jgi:prevent-host-death family protein